MPPSRFYGLDWKPCLRTPSVVSNLSGRHQGTLTRTWQANRKYPRMVRWWTHITMLCIMVWTLLLSCNSSSKCSSSIVCILSHKHSLVTLLLHHWRFVYFLALLYIYYMCPFEKPISSFFIFLSTFVWNYLVWLTLWSWGLCVKCIGAWTSCWDWI